MQPPLPFNEADRLKVLESYKILDTEPEEAFDDLTTLAANICGTPIALVSLIDANRQWFKSRVGLAATETPRELAFCAHAILQPEDLLVVPNALEDARFATNPLVTSDPNIRFYAGKPLVTPGGFALGTLCAIDTIPRDLSPDQIEALQALGRQVISQMELRINLAKLEHTIARREQVEEELRSANRAKSEFLANMSHELRTPLNGILGCAQILKKEKSLTDQQKGSLGIIHQCGEHLLTLINDILDLSKIEARKMDLHLTEFHLPEFLQGIVQIFQIRATQKGIALIYEPLTQLPSYIRGDEKRLRQILMNLLSNAVKFTDRGQVTFKVGDRDGKLRFQVEDSGIGIASTQLEEIFAPFQQVGDQSRKMEGTGLGLAISRQLVEVMGSELQVKSTLGEGSVFWLDLDLPECQCTDPQQDELTIIGVKGSKRILVVDDRWENRSILVGMLQPLGFEIVEAVDGLDCLNKAGEFEPDAILMDIEMPVLDGIEATRRLRTLPNLQEVVVIGNSASVYDLDRQKSGEAGCNDFLSKPVHLEELLEKLRFHLGLEWIYEEAQPPSSSTPNSELRTSNSLITPPPAEIAVLFDLAMMGDLKGIVERAAKLELNEDWVPFATHLRQLAKGFEEKQLLEFVKQYRGEYER